MQLAAQIGSTPASPNPKVRAITGFVRLDASAYQKQIADALVVLRKVKAEFESSGYEVETVRIRPSLSAARRGHRKVKAEFESSGYEVETVRLTTQPLDSN